MSDYVHDRINGAYKAGVRHCLELIEWAKAESIKSTSDTTFWLALLETKMQELHKTLYV